jgi:O-acetyl-ADP-ribose deacetylase (regulator of RNase III)
MVKTKEQLMATYCQALRKNDPIAMQTFSLREYDVDWKQHARKVAEALKEHLDRNHVTSCGIAALAKSLQRPCTLKN